MTALPARRTTAAHRPDVRRARIGALAFVVALLAAGAGLAAAKPREPARTAPLEHAEAARPACGGVCTGVAEGHDRAHTEHALDAALADVARLGATLARDDPGSELAALERRALESRVTCSSALWSALSAALDAAEETDGAYDPTVVPLERAWAAAGAGRPDPAALAQARAATGWRLVVIEPGARAVRLQHDGTTLDLDGVAAGVALDRAVDSLRADRVRRARLTLGGVTAAFADEGAGWGVSVPDPRGEGGAALSVTVREGAIATFGPASSLIDPRSGSPVRSTACVTVVARSAARAQALARALLVMGREAAARFVAARPGLGALWLEPDGDDLDGWRWNMPPVTVPPGSTVRWED